MDTGGPRHESAAEAFLDLLAAKVAAAMAEKPAPLINGRPGTVIEPPEQVMHAREAAEFLGMTYDSFRASAPAMPRAKV